MGCRKIGCMVIGGFVLLFIVASVILNFLVDEEDLKARMEERYPGYTNYDLAEDLISTDKEGVAHGNTQLAADMAMGFSEMMTAQRKAFISGEDDSLLSLSGNKFLTYCLVTDEVCIYLLHVPSLRDYEDEAKDFMVDLSYDTGNLILSNMVEDLPPKLIVVVQGAFLTYKRVSGTPGEGSEVSSVIEEESELYGYFKDLETIMVKPSPGELSTDSDPEPDPEPETPDPAPATPNPSASTMPDPAPAEPATEVAANITEPAPMPEPTPAPEIEAKHWRTWIADGGGSMRGRFLGIKVNSDGSESLRITQDGVEKKLYGIEQFSDVDVAYARAVMAGEEPVQDGSWLITKVPAGETPEVTSPPEVRSARTWTTMTGRTIDATLVALLEMGGAMQVALQMEDGQIQGVAEKDLTQGDRDYIEDVKVGREP